jgi:hypothetical protein
MVILSKIGVAYPCLLNVEHVLSRFGANSLTLLIMTSLMTQGGLQEEGLASGLVYFGVNGVNTFQGLKFGVIVQIQSQDIPFVANVHYMVHWINLVIQTISHLLLQCLYVYFTTALKEISSLPNW